MKQSLIILSILLYSLNIAAQFHGEIHLKNGYSVKGYIVSDLQTINIQTDKNNFLFMKSDIASIDTLSKAEYLYEKSDKKRSFRKLTTRPIWSVRTGLNISSLKSKSNYYPYNKSKAGFHIGIITDIPLNLKILNGVSIQTGIFYSLKGTKDQYDTTLPFHYCQLPIHIAYRYNWDSISFSVFTGPFFSLGSGLRDSDTSRGFSFETGWSVGGGIQYYQYYLGIQYDWGVETYAYNNPQSRNFSLSIGYEF